MVTILLFLLRRNLQLEEGQISNLLTGETQRDGYLGNHLTDEATTGEKPSDLGDKITV